MTKQYIIRHKETHKQLFTRERKGVWRTAGHAKAAFTNMIFWAWQQEEYGVNFAGHVRYADQDVFEVVELVREDTQRLTQADALLRATLVHLDNTHGYESDIWYAIRAYFGEKEE